MHKANGYAHMARAAGAQGLTELILPTWEAPRFLAEISARAVADLRVVCTLRSEKYGKKERFGEFGQSLPSCSSQPR